MPPSATLDRGQLREVTLDDPQLMRDLLIALIDDTTSQMERIASAIQAQDPQQCLRLAHSSKGACANVGAQAAADVLRTLEHQATAGRFAECERSLATLAQELDALRAEVG